MVFITNQNVFVFLALFLMYLGLEGRRAFVILLVAVASFGITDWTGSQLKDFFMRPRPCQTLDHVVLLVKCTGLSLPSNHAANSFAFAMPFVFLSKMRFRWVMLGFAAVVAYSRIYVGVHYPGDVAAGAALGTTISIGISYLFLRFRGNEQPVKAERPEEGKEESTNS
jgi:undecaprenyl-diphosphatase